MDWYYQEDGVQVGPLTEDEFDMRVRLGRIGPNTMVWNETMRGWQQYSSMKAAVPPVTVLAPEAPRAPMIACSQCLRQFPQTEMIQYQNSWVCASCKPLFFQKIKEGGTITGVHEYGQFWPRLAAKLID